MNRMGYHRASRHTHANHGEVMGIIDIVRSPGRLELVGTPARQLVNRPVQHYPVKSTEKSDSGGVNAVEEWTTCFFGGRNLTLRQQGDEYVRFASWDHAKRCERYDQARNEKGYAGLGAYNPDLWESHRELVGHVHASSGARSEAHNN
jgi:hypothetical protein